MTTVRFWIDLENAPDVLFFEPIAKELRRQGHDVLTTTRPFSSVPELARLYGIGGEAIGNHGGKQGWRKVAFGLTRSASLVRWAQGKRIDLAVGFGSRPLAVACAVRRLPNATIFDYEHVSVAVLNRFCDWVFVPMEVSVDYLAERGVRTAKLVRYTGLKEEVYTGEHHPDVGLRTELAVDEDQILVIMRPPAVSAHYHDALGERICEELLERIGREDNVVCLLLTRDGETLYDRFFDRANIDRLPHPVRGLDLIAVADLVVSGGGTMVREASALGVPSYSIFTGKPGAVDERLAGEGRLCLVRIPEDLDRVKFERRPHGLAAAGVGTGVRDFFVDELLRCCGRSR